MKINVGTLVLDVRNAIKQDYTYCYRLTKRNMHDYFVRHWGSWKPSAFRKGWKEVETLVLFSGGVRRGYVSLKKKSDCLYIDNIQLSGTTQGKGVGTALVAFIEKMAKKAKKDVKLTVFQDNPAKKLYERLGYKDARKNDDSSILMQKKYSNL